MLSIGVVSAQTALAEAQQRLLVREQQGESPTRGGSLVHGDSVSPQKLQALQATMQDLHAEVAELRAIAHQKNAELDTLHRCVYCSNELPGCRQSAEYKIWTLR